MKVTSVKKTVEFKQLAVGDVYLDCDDNVCIKTADEIEDNPSYGRCLAFVFDGWIEEEEHQAAHCVPIEAELRVGGYKEVN